MRLASLLGLGRDGFERFAPGFPLHLGATYARLQFQQFQLRAGQRIALRPVLLDQLFPQPLFQQLDLQLREIQLPQLAADRIP